MRAAVFRAAIGVMAAVDAAGAGAAAAGGNFSRRLNPVAQDIMLDAALTEVSGLADAGGGQVFAHDDERALIYELDPRSGRTLRKVAFGAPPIAGDFEAIVAHDGKISLMTSAGVIYRMRADARQTVRRPEIIDTTMGAICEIESLATDGADDFFLACKEAERRLVVYQWSPAKGLSRLFQKKLETLAPNPKTFRAADMVFDKATRTLLVLDSSVGALLEVTLSGDREGYWRLGGRHQQAEGLALLPTGELVVADEGNKGKGNSKRGYLTIYPPRSCETQ